MKSYFPILLVAAGTLFLSCNSTNNNNNVTPVNPYLADSLSGYLASVHVVGDSTNAIGAFDEQEALAFFFAHPNDTATILVDSVAVNGANIEVDQEGTGYFETNNFIPALDMSGTCTWSVAGNATIPTFSYNNAVSYPSFSGSLPDTITKANGATFNLQFSNADSVIIGIAGDSLGNYLTKAFSPSSTTQQFSSAEISTLLTTSQLGPKNILEIIVYRKTIQTFSGKKMLFSKMYTFYHSTWVL